MRIDNKNYCKPLCIAKLFIVQWKNADSLISVFFETDINLNVKSGGLKNRKMKKQNPIFQDSSLAYSRDP